MKQEVKFSALDEYGKLFRIYAHLQAGACEHSSSGIHIQKN